MHANGKKSHHHFLCKLTWHTYDQLEDFRLDRQRQERRWVSKRELIELAVRQLVGGRRGGE